MKLIITVDVEADNQWSFDGRISVENLRCLPRFQSLCEFHGFVPTYLVAYECLQDQDTVASMRGWQERGSAEVGSHLQPWTTPPFTDDEKRDPAMQAFPCELPEDDFVRKLENLTAEIERSMGRAPRSFRAARWGMSGPMLPQLLRLGYVADCSVTPKISWQDMPGLPGGPGGPDFRRAPVAPYWPSEADICKPGCGEIVEVPVTLLYTGSFVSEGSRLARWFSCLEEGTLKRILNRSIFKGKWLRIGPESRFQDWEALYRAAQRSGLEVLEFMIHSSELMPGCSPLVRTGKDAEAVMEIFSAMLEYFRCRGVTGCTLEEFATLEREKRHESSRFRLPQSPL
jgi:hypothetical protein